MEGIEVLGLVDGVLLASAVLIGTLGGIAYLAGTTEQEPKR